MRELKSLTGRTGCAAPPEVRATGGLPPSDILSYKFLNGEFPYGVQKLFPLEF